MTSIEQKMSDCLDDQLLAYGSINVERAATECAKVARDEFADCIQWAGQNGWECPFFKDALWYHEIRPTCNSAELFDIYINSLTQLKEGEK